ncbi:unnamed protein product, partial [Heterosigma akashiwo]
YTQPSQSDYTLESQMKLLEERVRSQEKKVIFVADFKCHNIEWLKLEKNNQLGLKLEEFCQIPGLKNVVKQPTRKDAFLDLIMNPGHGRVHILPKLGSSDHRTIYAELDLGLVGIEEPSKQRKVFHWGKARWGELKK